MRVYKGFNNLPTFTGAVVTIGSFDGLHRGHLSLLNETCSRARECGGESVVMTFEPHPRIVLGRTDGLRLLTSLEEKVDLLSSIGVDNLIVIPFDRDFSRLSYDEFVKQCLVEKIGVKTLVVGYNHHFGRGNEGSLADFVKLSEELGFEILKVEEWRADTPESVSSTVVRRMVAAGSMEGVSELLSRPYLVVGQVDGDGRVWLSESLKAIPPAGKYTVRIGGIESSISIDDNGVIMCDRTNERVAIEILR
ncbi:MAG: adenylyltransferase/cytidyltransferase family protein [Rikenellaceae bacterium]